MLNQEVYDKVVAAFAARFGGKPAKVAYAPGRIEVLGNHTDYNEGYVFSAAIDKGTFFAVSPTEDAKVTLVALDLDETYECELSAIAPLKSGATWANYVLGTFNYLFDGNPAAAKTGLPAARSTAKRRSQLAPQSMSSEMPARTGKLLRFLARGMSRRRKRISAVEIR